MGLNPKKFGGLANNKREPWKLSLLATDWKASFYRTSSGNEIDLILAEGRHRVAVECKTSPAPEITRGFRQALVDIDASEAWLIAPVKEAYPGGSGVTVAPLQASVIFGTARSGKDWVRAGCRSDPGGR